MARTTGSDGEKTLAAIREAAVSLIARHGYEAVTMRQLGEEVGVQAAALYRYFPTKEELLFTLMREHMEGLIASWQAERPPVGDPYASLAAYVGNHIRFHVARRHSTHVSNLELRSLSPEKLTAVLRLRNAYEKGLRQILRLRDRRCRPDRDGDHPDDHRRHRLVPSGRAAVGRGSDGHLSHDDDAPRRRA
jgi:AcrR family transcriptional regulator